MLELLLLLVFVLIWLRRSLGNTMDLKYFTRFELMSEREKKFFKQIGTELNIIGKQFIEISSELGNKTVDIYKKTPRAIKAGTLVTLAVLGTLGAQKFLEKKEEPERIHVRYGIDTAPYQQSRERSDYVTIDELKKLQRDSYVFNLKVND